MALIEVDRLQYTYPTGDAPALKDISFSVETGELLAIVGANQAGKSTLCFALSGLIPHFFLGDLRGRVSIGGMDAFTYPHGLPLPGVGLVLQNPINQISGVKYTVFDEIAFGLENLGVHPGEMPGRIEDALQQTGLAHLAEHSPFTLSGGQQQRLALACILAIQPSILILDEPTSMLDPGGVREIFSILKTLIGQGVTIIVSEHRLEWIAETASRVIALENGQVVLDGPPRQVLASPRLAEIGVGQTRYTRAARLASGVWPAQMPLPVTLEQAVSGFLTANARNKHED